MLQLLFPGLEVELMTYLRTKNITSKLKLGPVEVEGCPGALSINKKIFKSRCADNYLLLG